MNFEDMVIKRLSEKRDSIADAVLSGRLPNFPEYTRLVGEYAALTRAINEIKELSAEVRDDE